MVNSVNLSLLQLLHTQACLKKKMAKRKSSNLATIFLGMPAEEGGVKCNNGKDLL